MDFGLSPDQKMLAESVRGHLASRVPIDRIRQLREADCPNDREIWQELARLGATGILVPAERGGSGLSLLDAALVAEALGHSVTPAPFVSSAIMATLALRDEAAEGSAGWLEAIAAGRLVIGVAMTELFSVREQAGVDLEGGRLSGKVMMALDAHGADLVLVPVDRDCFAVIRCDAPGVSIERLATIDPTRCTSEIRFESTLPEAIRPDAGGVLASVMDAGRIALAADTIGACSAMIEQAVAYAGERRQFGRVIGSFQSVKHMCAEMIADLEPARSLLWHAAHAFDHQPEEAPLLASHLLAHVSEIGREIASVATQVHGGTGWTDEQNLHFWFKRIGVARHLLGGPEFLRARAATLQEIDVNA